MSRKKGAISASTAGVGVDAPGVVEALLAGLLLRP